MGLRLYPPDHQTALATVPLAGTAVEGKYIETGRWRGEAVTVRASDWAGVVTTRNVLDCTDPADAWAVPAGILAALVDT